MSIEKDHYDISPEPIGTGGMSVVYKVQDRRDQRFYAMKMIRENADDEKKQSQKACLAAEARLMGILDHPAIPRIHEIMEERDQIYLVMEYIDGISLADFLKKRGPQKEEIVVTWAKQLCQVLSYLHEWEPPVIHGDLKPGNLLLTPDGQLHLVDFGAADQVTKSAQRSSAWGTKGYAPWERYAGYMDIRSDIYGLGVTLYQLITGLTPEKGSKMSGRVGGLHRPGGFLSRRYLYKKYGISSEFQEILRRCIEKRPGDRYPDCRSLYQDLCGMGAVKRIKKKNFLGSLMWGICAAGVLYAFWAIWKRIVLIH